MFLLGFHKHGTLALDWIYVKPLKYVNLFTH